MQRKTLVTVLLLALACAAMACTPAREPRIPEGLQEVGAVTVLPTPQPTAEALSGPNAAEIAHGRYLVELIGCGACHTDGAILGEPNAGRLLAGSNVGIAYTSPLQEEYPGVVYPPNLTPDPETGLGKWTDQEIAAAIRSGVRRHGSGKLIAMSWPLYQGMSDADVDAIVAYLRAIPAVRHRAPPAVMPGTRAPSSYVHFGVYRAGPERIQPP
jgi:mono/diheme cytochrome c family protein